MLAYGVSLSESCWRPATHSRIFYCTVLYCTGCILLYCTVLAAFYCTVLYCTVLQTFIRCAHCTVLAALVVRKIYQFILFL